MIRVIPAPRVLREIRDFRVCLELLDLVTPLAVQGAKGRPDQRHRGHGDRQCDGQERREELTPRLQAQVEGGWEEAGRHDSERAGREGWNGEGTTFQSS